MHRLARGLWACQRAAHGTIAGAANRGYLAFLAQSGESNAILLNVGAISNVWRGAHLDEDEPSRADL